MTAAACRAISKGSAAGSSRVPAVGLVSVTRRSLAGPPAGQRDRRSPARSAGRDRQGGVGAGRDAHPVAGREPGHRGVVDLRDHRLAGVGQHGHPPERPEEAGRHDGGGAARVLPHHQRLGPDQHDRGAGGGRPGQQRHARPQHVRLTRLDRGRQPVVQADELGDERGGGVRVQLARRRQLLELAVAHHADPVGDGQRLLLVVGDEQRRGADLELDRAGSRRAAARAPWRPAPTAARRAAAPAAGSPAPAPARPAAAGRRRARWRTRSACADSPTRSSISAARASRCRACVFRASCSPNSTLSQHGQMREQAVGLEHHAHVALVGGHLGDVLAADRDACPTSASSRPARMPQRGGLAAARRAEQGDELAGLDVQGEPVEGACTRAVDPAQVVQSDADPSACGRRSSRTGARWTSRPRMRSARARRPSPSDERCASSTRNANSSTASDAATDVAPSLLPIRTICDLQRVAAEQATRWCTRRAPPRSR